MDDSGKQEAADIEVFDLSALIKKIRKGGNTEFRKVSFYRELDALAETLAHGRELDALAETLARHVQGLATHGG